MDGNDNPPVNPSPGPRPPRVMMDVQPPSNYGAAPVPAEPPVPPTPPPEPTPIPVPPPKPAPDPSPVFAPPRPQPVQPPQPEPPTPEPPATPAPTLDFQAPKPKKRKGKRLFIVLVILVVLLLAGGAAAYWFKFRKTTSNSSANNTNAVPSVQEPVDGKLVLSPQITPQATTKTQTVKTNTGQQLNLSDGFSFMVNKVADFVSSDQYNQPPTGQKFVAVTIVGGNRSNSGSIIFSDAFFQVMDASGNQLNASIVDEQVPNNPFSTLVNLKPGQQATGTAVFAVKNDSSALTLVYKKQYQNSQTKSVVTVQGEVPIR